MNIGVRSGIALMWAAVTGCLLIVAFLDVDGFGRIHASTARQPALFLLSVADGVGTQADDVCVRPRRIGLGRWRNQAVEGVMMLIRKSVEADLAAMFAIVNDAAQAYRGVIPADRWHEPYMPMDELLEEVASGVVFWVAEEEGRLLGVMGIQDKGDVALVRHAYVSPTMQRGGVGTALLRHVAGLTQKAILIGTWAEASWAVDFYRRNGFTVVSKSDKDRLLRRYWSIPERQIETSVVLADRQWLGRSNAEERP